MIIILRFPHRKRHCVHLHEHLDGEEGEEDEVGVLLEVVQPLRLVMVLRCLAGNIVTRIARQCCLPGWSCWGRPRWWSARTWTATCRCIGRFVGSYGSTWEPLVFHSWIQLESWQMTSRTLTFQISSSCSAGKSRELRRGRRPHPSWSLDRLLLALCSLQQITVMMMIHFKY